MRVTSACLLVMFGLVRPLPAAELPKPLEQPVDLVRAVEGTPLQDVLAWVRITHGLAVGVDEAAFLKAGVDHVSDKATKLPRVRGAPLKLVLEIAAEHVGGTVRVNGNQAAIVPGKADLAAALPPPTDALKKKLAGSVTLSGVTPSKVRELVDDLSAISGVTIIVADWQFPAPAKRPGQPDDSWVMNTATRVTPGSEPLRARLDALAAAIGGKVVPGGDVVLILPALSPTAVVSHRAVLPRVCGSGSGVPGAGAAGATRTTPTPGPPAAPGPRRA